MQSPLFRSAAKEWYDTQTVGLTYPYRKVLQSEVDYLNMYIGDLRVSEIKPTDINNIVLTLAANNPHTNRPSSKSSLEKLVHTTNRIFEFSIDNDYCFKNPAKNSGKAIPKNAPKKVVTAINKSEQLIILQIPHKCQATALLMMLTGLRTSEALGLEWKDIDLNEKKLYIHQRAVRVASNLYEVQEGTKNGKARFVTIPNNLCEYLREKKTQARYPLVFPKTNGTVHTPSSWKSAWQSYMNELNWHYADQPGSKFDPRGYPKLLDINPHQLRHTYATLLYLSGVDVLTASKLLGHSSVQITLDIYTHLDEQFKTLDITNFNEYLENDLIF